MGPTSKGRGKGGEEGKERMGMGRRERPQPDFLAKPLTVSHKPLNVAQQK